MTLRPVYTLVVDGNAVTLDDRLIELRFTDKRGMEADDLSLQIDDADGLVELPRKGVTIDVTFGYHGQAQAKATLTVDETTHAGPPDIITVKGRAADFRSTLAAQQDVSYDDTTLQAIISTIAQRQGLKPVLSDTLASEKIDHIDQTNESDAHFITRLAQRYDAIASIKAGRLLFVARGTAKTATGKDMPAITIDRSQTSTHSYTDADRAGRVTGVTAYWQDKKKAKRQKVVVGSKEYTRSLKKTYATEAQARAAAKARLQKIQRSTKEFSFTLTQGNGQLTPEVEIQVTGFKKVINDTRWVVVEVAHVVGSSGGYTCEVKCEQIAQTT